MVRVFVYDGREFPDPDPNMSHDEVRQSMTSFFPELANAEVKTSERDADINKDSYHAYLLSSHLVMS